jgi:hypothetical protein
MRATRNVILCTVIVLMIASTASAAPSDFHWEIDVGDRIAYRYHGTYYDHAITDGLIHFDEEMYIQIDDISGVPYPLSTSQTPSVTPYWANGTPFSDYVEWQPFITGNFGMLGPFAMKLGNWTFLEEFTLDLLESSFHEVYHNRVGWINETSTMWNFTQVIYYGWNTTNFGPGSTSIKQYSKSDGVLNNAKEDYYQVGQDPFTLEISRIQNTSELVTLTVIAIGGAIAILTLVVIWKRKK